MSIAEFSPWTSLAGGALIGVAAVLLMLANGRIMGISGIIGGVAQDPRSPDTSWRLAFLAGLAVPAVVASMLGVFPAAPVVGGGVVVAAGFLVGMGTRMANGCTSGHGICGLARMSPRSLAAVGTFMAVAGLTVFVSRHVLGGM
ncbi:MAG: YeeE/YedE family protein [Magnetospirillum gryphiswaldense]|nr:YeeE/YedE family protein [Magnetospirillum gryphiswaldense]